MPGREELPSTLQRSPAQARETWVKAHDSAVQEYGEGERSHRVAYGALKHRFEKVGDHWEPKPGGARGPSDQQSDWPRGQSDESYGGVDANASQQHLLGLARRLGVRGRSAMTKQELAAAIEKENDRRTAAARSGQASQHQASQHQASQHQASQNHATGNQASGRGAR